MSWNSTARYRVINRRTGATAADGTSVECARRLGVTYGSFLTMVSRSRKGGTPYRIERLEEDTWQEEAAKRWNRMFGWYQARARAYPCRGCMRRSICDHTGEYCPAFARWFSHAYNGAVERLRRTNGRK